MDDYAPDVTKIDNSEHDGKCAVNATQAEAASTLCGINFKIE